MRIAEEGSKMRSSGFEVRFLRSFLGVLFLFGPCSSKVFAGTRNAASTSFADVSAAVSAAARGDSVLVPAGSITWSSTLTISKGVRLIGGNGGPTTITRAGVMIAINPDSTAIANEEVIQVSGFTFDGSNSAINFIHINGAGASATKPFKNLVITSNTFQNSGTGTSGAGVMDIEGQVRGVIGRNVFNRCNVIAKVMGNNVVGDWTNSAFYPFSYGSADNLYFEDNQIYWSSSGGWSDPGWIESGQGARFVVRYNTWNMANANQNELWDIHGFQYGEGSGQTGTMLVEYYGNTCSNANGYRSIHHRGSWGLFFNNIITGAGGMGINTAAYSSSCSGNWSGNYTTEVNNSYFFNNHENGRELSVGESQDNCGIAEGTHYFSRAAGNVTSGTGAPSGGSPTEGDGYWQASTATPTVSSSVIQSGILWKYTGGRWVPYYTPYTYPHPLSGGTPVETPPEITSLSSANGMQGQSFTYQITASGSPTSFAASGLPAGLSVSANSGLISGIPQSAGTFNATISASNANGNDSASLTVIIATPGAVIRVNPPGLSFPEIGVGQKSDLQLYVTNSGAGTLSGTATTSAPFSVLSGGSYSLVNGQVWAVTVRYSPIAAGSHNGTIAFTGGGGSVNQLFGSAFPVFSSLAFRAVDGLVSSPFTVDTGYVLQNTTTVGDPEASDAGRAVYGFSIATAGTYVVSAIVQASDTGSDSFYVNVDAEPVDPTMIWDIPLTAGFERRTMSWRGTATPGSPPEFAPATFTLAAGVHRLIVRGREPLARLDMIEISIADASARPSAPSNLRITP